MIHPTAILDTPIPESTSVWAYTHIMAGASVGKHCNIGSHCFIEAGAVIGDRCTIKNGVMIWEGVELGEGVFVGPGVVFTNDLYPRSPRKKLKAVRDRYRTKDWLQHTRVLEGATLGAGSVLLPVMVGEYALVAAGSVVTKDVPAHRLVKGNPAQVVERRFVCLCGRVLVPAVRCRRCKWKGQ